MWNKIKRYYSPFIDVFSFALLILTIIYVGLHYSGLPAEIPRHFNLAGEPDAWSGKEMLIGFIILYTFVLILCFILNYFLMVHPKNSREALRFINVPFIKKEDLTNEQVEIVRTYSARMLAILNLLISILFASIHYEMIQTALENQNRLGATVPIITGLLIVLPFVYVWKMYRDVKR